MTKESPLRAQPDSRILEADHQQGGLFDELDTSPDEQLLADYRQRYGLAEDPFSNDYSFPLFTGAGRRQVLDQLLHLAQFSNSLLVVAGEYGVGKTRLAHAFMDSLSESDLLCYLAVQSGQTLESILATIVETFDLPVDEAPSTEKLLSCLENFIEQQPDADVDGLAVIVLDNAHLLGDQAISVLTSLLHSFPQQNRFHIVLVGEPSLISRVERLSPENLLINDFYLPALNLAESVDYLNFRMEMADYLGPEIFSDSIVDAWWRQAQGQLAILHELAQERLLESVMPKQNSVLTKRPLPVIHIIAIALLISIVGLVLLYMGDEDSTVKSDAKIAVNSAVVQSSSLDSPSQTGQPAPVTVPQSGGMSALELTSTDTPVQPLLQSLPGQTSTTPSAIVDDRVVQEEVVPVTQLPATSSTNVIESSAAPSPAPTEQAPVVSKTEEPVYEEPIKQVTESKPVTKPAATEKVWSTNKIGQDRQILNWSASEYTIQLLGVSNHKAALDYVAAQPNKKDLLIFKSKRQGRDWFVVITGRFANNAQARQAIPQLPAAQRDAGPWPRDVKTIQNEIRSALQ